MAAGFKLPGQDWIDYTPLQTHFYDQNFQQFVAGSTPEEVAVIGIPPPGRTVWTEASVEAFAAAYPALDVGPWRRAAHGAQGEPATDGLKVGRAASTWVRLRIGSPDGRRIDAHGISRCHALPVRAAVAGAPG